MRHYPFIDLLRGIAALWVCVAHCLIWTGVPLPDLASPKLAVDLFMMISGFLMMAQVEAREVAEPMGARLSWLRFYLRRYFRIAPAYYLSLALVFVSSDWFPAGFAALRSEMGSGFFVPGDAYDPLKAHYDIPNLLVHLSFLFGLHPQASSSTLLPDWSLSLEMQFYLVFPLLFLACRRIGWERVALFIGVPVAATAAAWYVGLRYGWLPSRMSFAEPSLLLFKLQYFLIGMGVYTLVKHPGFNPRSRYFSLALLLGLCGLQVGYGAKRLVVIGMVFHMLAMARSESVRLAAFLNWPSVRRLSDSAYSVYLFHGFFIAMAGYGFAAELVAQPWLMVAWVVPAALLWAQLVERWVERPGIELGRHVIGRLPKAPVRSAAGA